MVRKRKKKNRRSVRIIETLTDITKVKSVLFERKKGGTLSK